MKLSDLKTYKVVGVDASGGTVPPAPTDNRDFLQKASDAVKASPFAFTAPLGEALGNSIGGITESIVQRSFAPLMNAGDRNNQNFGKIAGSAIESAALPGSLAYQAPASVLGAVAQYGGFGALQSGADALAQGGTAGDAAKSAALGGAIGAGTGGIFNLLGKTTKNIAPSVSSVTSGVPKAAIEQAGANPAAVKEGVSLSVPQVRDKAVSSLQTLFNDLNKEHSAVSKSLPNVALPQADDISRQLIGRAQDVAKQFKVATATGAEGLVPDFSKSSIVKGGEETAVKKALQTLSTWDDYSPQGLQSLNQRVNALKNYEEGAVSKSSAIVGKIHNAISDVIEEHVPVLHDLNKNYTTNRKVLDEISNVIGANAKSPTQIQSSVTRLDNIFKENKDQYISIIRELGERSGVDYLSLLAGGEFQRLLPGYIRSAVAVGSVGGVSSVAANPMSLLLLPLFSPRAVGAVARNAPKIADTSSKLARGAATQAIPAIAQTVAPQQKTQ